MKNENPIEEIWRIREEIGAEHGYDVDRLFVAMRKLETQYADRLVYEVRNDEGAAVLREDPKPNA